MIFQKSAFQLNNNATARLFDPWWAVAKVTGNLSDERVLRQAAEAGGEELGAGGEPAAVPPRRTL